MVIIESYPIAVILCLITMLCWGSWANTMKLTGKNWFFQLYYWDYSIGVVIIFPDPGFYPGQSWQ